MSLVLQLRDLITYPFVWIFGVLQALFEIIRKNIPTTVPEAKELLMALVVLGILFVVGYIIYNLLQHYHPRMFGLSHTEDVAKIDTEIRDSVALALTNYYLGVPLPNYLKAKGAYENIYNASASELGRIAADVEGRINFHFGTAPHDELHAILSSHTPAPTTHKEILTYLSTALSVTKTGGNNPIVAYLKRHSGEFKAQLDALNTNSLFNFIDYLPYEQDTPEKDKTLRKYGSVATPSGHPLSEIFDTSAFSDEVAALVSVDNASIGASKAAQNERLKTLLVLLRSSKQDVLAGTGITESDYHADVRENTPGASFDAVTGALARGVTAAALADDPSSHPRTKLSLGVARMEADLNEIEAMIAAGGGGSVTNSDLDKIQHVLFFQYETYLRQHYDADGQGPEPVLSEKLFKSYMYAYGELIAVLQYQSYKTHIDDSIFVMLYWYYGHKQDFFTNVQKLSAFYLSFNELALFKKYDDHVDVYRQWRNVDKSTVDDMFVNNLFMPNFNLYIVNNIYKGVVLDWLDWTHTFNGMQCYWDYVRVVLSNPGTFMGESVDDGSVPRPCDSSGLKTATPSQNTQSTGVSFDDAAANDDIDAFTAAADPLKEPFDGGNTPPNAAPAREGFAGIFTAIFDIAKGIAALPSMAVNLVNLCISLVSDVIPMIMNLLRAVMAVINMIAEFAKDPMHNFVKLLGLVAGFIMYLFTLLAMLVLNLKIGYPLGLMIMVVLYKIAEIFIGAWTIVFNAALFAFIVGLGFVLAILDGVYFDGALTTMLYNWVLACETSPFSWMENAGYENGNKYQRVGGFCMSPCAEGYEPGAGGFVCSKKPAYVPKQCPQALVQRIYNDKSISTPYILTQHMPATDWGNLSKSGKAALVLQVQADKVEYGDACAHHMSGYNDVTANICRNMDAVAGSTGDHAAMSSLCNQAFCRNGNMAPWCYKQRKTTMTSASGLQSYNIFVQLLLYSIIIVAFIAIIYLLYQGKMTTPGGPGGVAAAAAAGAASPARPSS